MLGVILLTIGVITVLYDAPKFISVWILFMSQWITAFSIVKEKDER